MIKKIFGGTNLEKETNIASMLHMQKNICSQILALNSSYLTAGISKISVLSSSQNIQKKTMVVRACTSQEKTIQHLFFSEVWRDHLLPLI